MRNSILFFLVLVSCKPTLKRNYESNCILYGKPEYILYIEKNNQFRIISFMNDTIEGEWSLNRNKLTLKSDSFIDSESFNIQTDSIFFNSKYTSNDGYEEYVLKNKKLFLILKEGVYDKCFYY
ncbi:hypothetical protein [Flavobacterium sp. NRK F7]|uniref:hypothetical protein n=1 Tax=Flavobacterium sp. NRK F7 TaxID=2954930 RepID=UPI00209077EA|nr:hypothetical protein [Flavobacterium sp. NRK F7]MCO6161326.1 hypothetical protein [Flavobacterium sp. NRK F7]